MCGIVGQPKSLAKSVTVEQRRLYRYQTSGFLRIGPQFA